MRIYWTLSLAVFVSENKYKSNSTMKKLISSIIIEINIIFNYIYYRYSSNNSTKCNTKALIINISKPHKYDRYLYNLIKFFEIEGYDIYMPSITYNSFRKLSIRRYTQYLTADKIFIRSLKKTYLNIINLNDNNLSCDYFTTINSNHITESYHIPMAMHPLFYQQKIWNKTISSKNERRNSIFMVGNFNKNAYNNFNSALFKMHSRIDAYNHLNKLGLLTEISNHDKLTNSIKNSDQECIIIDSSKIYIKMIDLRETISNYYFYLALPGVLMPQCHNLIEAMSVGAIPIIHINYARLLKPHLKHMENSLIYNKLENIQETFYEAFRMKKEDKMKIKNNVIKTYNKYYTPKSVVKKVASGYTMNYLQAEKISIDEFRKHRHN